MTQINEPPRHQFWSTVCVHIDTRRKLERMERLEDRTISDIVMDMVAAAEAKIPYK